MVDLGCHAGAGRHKNVSDALLWLRYFNHSGSVVLGVDANEDFVHDLQHRFDAVPPFDSLRGVRKRAMQLALHVTDNVTVDLFFALKGLMTCCAGQWCTMWNEPHWTRLNHYCRVTRERMGLQPAPWPLPPSSYPPSVFSSLRLGNVTAKRWPPYHVRTGRGPCRYALEGAPWWAASRLHKGRRRP